MKELILTNLTNFGLVAVIVFNVVQYMRSGNSSLVKKMLEDYKERNGQLEGILETERKASEAFKMEMTKVISDYKLEIVRLQTENNERAKHNSELKDLLQDKNPDVVNVLKEIRDFLQITDKQNKIVLQYQTEILEEWKERSMKVDEASLSHKGELMRAPLPEKQ